MKIETAWPGDRPATRARRIEISAEERIMVAVPKKTNASHRGGFTLVELMIVIVIITVLLALLLPAINRARVRARVTQVKSEISVIDSAIAAFRAEYGIEPPGSIRLYASASGWNTPGSTPAAEAIRIRSRAYIRQVWPQFDFNSSAGGAFWSVDTDLNGAECLVFFLGGVGDANTSPPTADWASGHQLIGFSKDPSQPFGRTGVNRVKPFFDFVVARLVDKDGDTFPEYCDPIPSQTAPYVYFDSNDGRGYQQYPLAADWCNVDCWMDGYNGASSFATGTWTNGNWMKFSYYNPFQHSANPGNDISFSIPYNPKKYQIISPGFSGVGASSPAAAYGTGGLYDQKQAAQMTGTPDGDNITNFNTGGTLSGE